MNIDSRQIDEKPKKVGDLRGQPVYHLRTKGGLHVLVMRKGASFETLGTGPHRAVARFIAGKHEPEIVWSDLSKADHVTPDSFQMVLPKYEKITDDMRQIQAETSSRSEAD